MFDLYSTTIMQHSKNDFIDSTGFKLTKGFGIITNRNLRINQIKKDFSVFGPVAACAIYNRTIFSKIGLFFEKYFLYEEDIDIAIRAHLYGYKCGHIMNAKSTHVGSASLGYYSPVKQYYISRNKVWLFFLNMHNEIMLKSLFFFLIHQFFILMKSIRYFNVYSYFSGVMDAFKELNKLSSVRNFRQSKVKISPNDFYNNLSKINLRNKILGQ
jgi:GT2 family glycosyltransferase